MFFQVRCFHSVIMGGCGKICYMEVVAGLFQTKTFLAFSGRRAQG